MTSSLIKYIRATCTLCHGPLTGYANLRVAHAPGMPRTFSPPPTSEEIASYWSRHASRHVHVSKASKMNLDEFWKRSKRILNKGQNEVYDTITEDGTKLENPEEAKSHIREYFRDLYQARPGKPEYEQWTEHIQQTVLETDKTMEKLSDPNPITTNEIKQSFRQLRRGKSKGPDQTKPCKKQTTM